MPQIGWFEILVVVVLAILIIGPKDFPIMLKKIKSTIFNINNKENFIVSVESLKQLKYFSAAKQIFSIIKNQNKKAELKFVGGCVRKLLNHEEINDIDIATNLTPEEIKNILG